MYRPGDTHNRRSGVSGLTKTIKSITQLMVTVARLAYEIFTNGLMVKLTYREKIEDRVSRLKVGPSVKKRIFIGTVILFIDMVEDSVKKSSFKGRNWEETRWLCARTAK